MPWLSGKEKEKLKKLINNAHHITTTLDLDKEISERDYDVVLEIIHNHPDLTGNMQIPTRTQYKNGKLRELSRDTISIPAFLRELFNNDEKVVKVYDEYWGGSRRQVRRRKTRRLKRRARQTRRRMR
jgi:hypothetical protein